MICAAYQAKPASDIKLRFKQIQDIVENADNNSIDFICFPEGFLTGYYDDEQTTRENSFNIHDNQFKNFIKSLANFRTTIIIGFNEIEDSRLFDSAAVIEKGKLIGIQRKHYQYHTFCTPGTTFLPFYSKNICFGVLLCLDANYFKPARLFALQGAQILFVPSCNKVSQTHHFSQRPFYYSHFAARSHENRCWLIAADWAKSNDTSIYPGHTAIYNSDGEEIIRSKEYVADLLTIDIPNNFFLEKKRKKSLRQYITLGYVKKILKLKAERRQAHDNNYFS